MATHRYGISIDFRRLVDQRAGRSCCRKAGSSHGDPHYRSIKQLLMRSEQLIRRPFTRSVPAQAVSSNALQSGYRDYALPSPFWIIS